MSNPPGMKFFWAVLVLFVLLNMALLAGIAVSVIKLLRPARTPTRAIASLLLMICLIIAGFELVLYSNVR